MRFSFQAGSRTVLFTSFTAAVLVSHTLYNQQPNMLGSDSESSSGKTGSQCGAIPISFFSLLKTISLWTIIPTPPSTPPNNMALPIVTGDAVCFS